MQYYVDPTDFKTPKDAMKWISAVRKGVEAGSLDQMTRQERKNIVLSLIDMNFGMLRLLDRKLTEEQGRGK